MSAGNLQVAPEIGKASANGDVFHLRMGGSMREGKEVASNRARQKTSLARSRTLQQSTWKVRNRTMGCLRSPGPRLGELPVAWSLLIETIITLGPNVGGDHCHGAGRSVSGGQGDL